MHASTLNTATRVHPALSFCLNSVPFPPPSRDFFLAGAWAVNWLVWWQVGWGKGKVKEGAPLLATYQSGGQALFFDGGARTELDEHCW